MQSDFETNPANSCIALELLLPELQYFALKIDAAKHNRTIDEHLTWIVQRYLAPELPPNEEPEANKPSTKF